MGFFKRAVSDVAETIRRAFQNPRCFPLDTGFTNPASGRVEPLEARSMEAPFRLKAILGAEHLAFHPDLQVEPMCFSVRILDEDAWASWAAGAKVCEMSLFLPGACNRLTVTPLPRKAQCRKAELPPLRASTRVIRGVLKRPAVRQELLRIKPPRTQKALELALGWPIAIPGEDLQKLPKALNMRYTLQLVKGTGENIRNLEVLGVFLLPAKGVTSLRHDPQTGRLLVNLGIEAVGARRKQFILARKKDDRGYVSCFVEE